MRGVAKIEANGGGDAADDLSLLIRLLKLGSFINTPMKQGVCDPVGLGATELKVLMALAGEGALAGHELVDIMGMPAMNVSRAIAALRGRGWLEDAADGGNRRRRPVRLTPEGETAYREIKPLMAALAATLMDGLGAAQKRQLAVIADRLVSRMAASIDAHHAGQD